MGLNTANLDCLVGKGSEMRILGELIPYSLLLIGLGTLVVAQIISEQRRRR